MAKLRATSTTYLYGMIGGTIAAFIIGAVPTYIIMRRRA